MNLISRPDQIEEQLVPLLGDNDAATVTSVANGLGTLLAQDAVASAFLATLLFPAIAVLYGNVLRITRETVETFETELNAGVEFNDADHRTLATARATLTNLDRIVEATSRSYSPESLHSLAEMLQRRVVDSIVNEAFDTRSVQ